MQVAPLVEIHNVGKRFGPNEILKSVSLTAERGSVTCIIGPSGAGKSTLLRCINHLEVPDEGYIIVDGERVGYEYRHDYYQTARPKVLAQQRRRIGMVFQHFNLFPHLSAVENVSLAPILTRVMGRKEAVRAAEERLASVGLGHRLNAYPADLSGGEQQRVAIARSLALEPRLMLFDEPTSALDPELVGEVLGVMKRLATQGMTMIVVTHEMSFADQVADRIVVMDGGSIIEIGPSQDVLHRPQSARTRTFLSRTARREDRP
jgi:polar amino acid transport system ATP-binding protein